MPEPAQNVAQSIQDATQDATLSQPPTQTPTQTQSQTETLGQRLQRENRQLTIGDVVQSEPFRQAPINAKIRLLSRLSPEFAALPLPKQADLTLSLINPGAFEEYERQKEYADKSAIGVAFDELKDSVIGPLKVAFTPSAVPDALAGVPGGNPFLARLAYANFQAADNSWNLGKQFVEQGQRDNSLSERARGRFLETAAFIPLVGPFLAQTEENLSQGQIAAGLTDLAMLAAPTVFKAARFSLASRLAFTPLEDVNLTTRGFVDAPTSSLMPGTTVTVELPVEGVRAIAEAKQLFGEQAAQRAKQIGSLANVLPSQVTESAGLNAIQDIEDNAPGVRQMTQIGRQANVLPSQVMTRVSVLTPEQAAQTLNALDRLRESPEYVQLPEDVRGRINDVHAQLAVNVPESLANQADAVSAAKAELPNAEETLPEPASAAVKQPSALQSYFGFVPDALRSSGSLGAKLVDTILESADAREQWTIARKHQIADLSEGLDGIQRKMAGELLDTTGSPDDIRARLGQTSERFARPYDADTIDAAVKARQMLEDIHDEIVDRQSSAASPLSVGYLSEYFPRIQAEAEANGFGEMIRNLTDFHFARPLIDFFKSRDVEAIEPTTRYVRPSSRFVNERTGKLADYALDVNRVLPAYVDSIARLNFDRPALEAARAMLKDVEQGTPFSELARAFVDNFARPDYYPQMAGAFKRAVNALMRTTARSFIDFNPAIQSLHLGRVLIPFAELDTGAFLKGLARVASDPARAYQDVMMRGLIPGAGTPFSLLGTLDKLDRVGAFWNVATFIPDAIAFYGKYESLVESGLDAASAEREALKYAKNLSMSSFPERKVGIFQNTGTYLDPFRDLIGQYKSIPLRIADFYARTVANAAENPAKLARLMTGTALLAVTEAMTGAKLIHFGALGSFDIPAVSAVARGVLANLAKAAVAGRNGDADKASEYFGKALSNTVVLMTPGGSTVKRALTKGPQAILTPAFDDTDDTARVLGGANPAR